MIVLGFLGFMAGMAIIRGLFFVWLWNWFVQPVFDGMPDINVAEALGLSLFVTFLTYQYAKSDITDSDDPGEALLKGISYALITYAFWGVFALIIKAFM